MFLQTILVLIHHQDFKLSLKIHVVAVEIHTHMELEVLYVAQRLEILVCSIQLGVS